MKHRQTVSSIVNIDAGMREIHTSEMQKWLKSERLGSQDMHAYRPPANHLPHILYNKVLSSSSGKAVRQAAKC